MDIKTLDNYSKALKQVENHKVFVHNTESYIHTSLRIVGLGFNLDFQDHYKSSDNRDYDIRHITFSEARKAKIRKVFLEELELEVQEQLEIANNEFNKILLEKLK